MFRTACTAQCIVQYALLLLPAFSAQATIRPRHSWDTLSTMSFIHLCNESGLFSERAMDTIAKFPLVTIEKGQGFSDKDCSKYGPGVEFPCAEQKIVEQCKVRLSFGTLTRAVRSTGWMCGACANRAAIDANVHHPTPRTHCTGGQGTGFYDCHRLLLQCCYQLVRTCRSTDGVGMCARVFLQADPDALRL